MSSPSPVTSNRTGANRPQLLRAAMINVEDQLGRPWIMLRFCITASGEAPIRCAISSATMALPMLSFPRYCSGTMLLETSASAMRWADSKDAAFENAVVAAAALGASSNCPIHMVAIARHMGVEHTLDDWQRLGPEIPLLVDLQPAGRFLGEMFHRGGGVPAVLKELANAGKLHLDVMTVSGKTLGETLESVPDGDREVIRSYGKPMLERAGYVVLSGNIFDSAVMKISVIDKEFRSRFLSDPSRPNVFEGRAIVFEGPEDYHDRLDDPALAIEEQSILIIRNCGPVGYPGSAEVVNMQPPARMLKEGINALPTMGDGRQSGTSGSPSILNVSPEAAVGGGLALLRTGDRIRIDLNTHKVDVLLPEGEMDARRAAWVPPALVSKTPWEEIYRSMVGQLGTGGCLESATLYLNILETRGESRDNH